MAKTMTASSYDNFFSMIQNLSDHCLAKYTPEQKKKMYTQLVEYNHMAEKAFLEKLFCRRCITQTADSSVVSGSSMTNSSPP